MLGISISHINELGLSYASAIGGGRSACLSLSLNFKCPVVDRCKAKSNFILLGFGNRTVGIIGEY